MCETKAVASHDNASLQFEKLKKIKKWDKQGSKRHALSKIFEIVAYKFKKVTK